MDRGLIKAAWNGDVQYLIQENDNNPTVLPAVALEGSENLLHVACFAGHVNFALKVIELRPGFCRELNKEGFSPLHITAAGGNVEIVKKLLEVNKDLCLIKGKDSKIPLHLAVVKGKVEVITELLLASLDSVECTTAHLETSLHLAVKNSQFEALQLLIQHLKHFNKEDLLNTKDIYGNTILHLAVSKKQYEVVNFLLNGQVTSTDKIELNALNKSGYTPLDMLLMFQSEAGDREIEDILIQAGARKTECQQSLPDQRRLNHSDTRHENGRPRKWSEFSHFFRYNQSKESPKEDDSVASTGNNTLSSTENNTTASEPHRSGTSIMGTNTPRSFILLMVANSVGFYTSIYMIYTLASNFPMQLELQIAMNGIVICYASAMGVTAPYAYMTIFFIFIPISVILMLAYGTVWLRYIWRNLTGPIEEEEQGPYIFD